MSDYAELVAKLKDWEAEGSQDEGNHSSVEHDEITNQAAAAIEKLEAGVYKPALTLADTQQERDRLRAAVDELQLYADVTFLLWDGDQSSKVGKRLQAMAGKLDGYSPDLDEVLKLAKGGDHDS